MPPLKSSAAFHEQRQSLEQTRTDHFLKRKFKSQPEQSELIRMPILAETSAEASLQASQLLKRAHPADDLNHEVSHQPGPMELIHKSILPVHSSFKQAIIETQFSKPSHDDLSADKGSNDSASSEQSSSQPRGPGPLSFPPVTLPGSTISSPTQPKPNTDRSAQRHKKPMDNGPKIKKLKYHQYIAPNQKEDKNPPPYLDSSYSKILQQQQLFLQLQILSQQQQKYSYQPIPCAPPRPQKDPLNEMKVADLKSELKLRSLPVYGTKNDLIERLRTYKELSGGSDTTSSPTAGGTTVPGAEGARKSSKTAAAITNTTSQVSLQFHQTSSLIPDASSLPPISVIPSDNLPAANSPEDSSFNSNPLGQTLSFQPCSTAQLSTDIKEEPPFSTPAPCQVSLKPASLQEHCPVSSTTHISTTTAPVLTIDKDKMLQEKDKQIEELTRMLRQKQKLVEALKIQLEYGKRGGQVQDPVVLVRVKQEPPEKPSVPLSYGHPLFPSSPSCKMDFTKVTVKQEAIEAEEIVSETTLRSPVSGLQFLTPEVQRQILLQIKPEHTSAKTNEEEHICLQQTTVQLAQQQAVKEKLLLQKQYNIQNQKQKFQMLAEQQNMRKHSQQRQQKSYRQQKQQQSQCQHEQPKQHPQLKQQTSPLKNQIKQQQLTKQPQKIQIQINLKQQQVLIQKTPQMQQLPPQVSQANLRKQPGSAPSLLKSDTVPTLVTDSNSNHFLIALTNHVTERQRADAPEAMNDNTLQQVQCTPSKLVQLPKADNQSTLVELQTQQNTKEVCSRLDVLYSPLSLASIKMTASSSDNKDTEHEDDFIDMILQTGGMSTTSKLSPDLSLDSLYPNSPALSPPPFPFQLLQSPPSPPNCDSTHPALTVQSELERLVDTTEEKQHCSNVENGRLEDFLESTTGKPLLRVEPGGLLALTDDLHSQMLCSPSILDHPPSPTDPFDRVAEVQQGLNINDWLDLTMGGQTDEETPTSGPETPCGIFSTDFLDSCLIL